MARGKDGGWRLPDDIDPPRRCICIPVPNDPAHRQAFFGALTQLGYQFNWERDDDHTAVPVSVLWMGIVLEAMHKFYNGAETMCFSCEELSECLAPLLEAQTAIFQQMLDVSKFGDNIRPGVPMTTGQKNTDLTAGTNPTCDLAITWAQSQQTIEYGDQLIRQGIALAESATNDLEILQVFTSLPVIDELGADAIAGYMETFLEGIQDNYFAQASPTYIEEAQCALFCLAKPTCTITPDMVYSVFYDRVTAHFGTPITAIATITDLFAYLVDQDIDGTIIADVMMMVIFGGGVLAQTFLGDAGTKPLSVLLKLAVNDANDDYLTLCIDCPNVLLSVYSDFGRATLKYSIGVTYGEPFDIEVDPATWGTNEFFAVWNVDVDYAYTVETGTYTPTTGETPWAYIDGTETVITGTAGDPATDLPTPGTAKGIFMNAAEADSTVHMVRITLTAP